VSSQYVVDGSYTYKHPRQFATIADAWAAAKSLTATFQGGHRPMQTPYYCPYCGWWHVQWGKKEQ
jgi:hypothetical protein